MMLWAFGNDNGGQCSAGVRASVPDHRVVQWGMAALVAQRGIWRSGGIVQKIHVTVLVAPPGQLLHKVLAHLAGDAHDWLVLAPAHLAQAEQKVFALSVFEDGPAVAAGCDCCSVRGPLVDALRDHFMLALQRRRAPYRQVLCVQDTAFDPAGLVAALSHDTFLSQRYQYAGCIMAVAGQAGAAIPPAWLQADVLVTQAADGVSDAMLFSINPWAVQVSPDDLSGPGWLMQRASQAALLPRPAPAAAVASAGAPAGGLFSPAIRQGGQLFQLAVSLPQPVARGRLYAALDNFLDQPDTFPLRLQGLVRLQPSGQWYVLRALHRHRQSLRDLTADENALLEGGQARQGAGGFLCLLQSAGNPRPAAQNLAQALGGQYRLLSPGNNPLPQEDARVW